MLFVHFNDQQMLAFQTLHDVAEALEADLALLKIRIVGLNGGLEDGGIDALEALVLEALQAFAEGRNPVVSVELNDRFVLAGQADHE